MRTRLFSLITILVLLTLPCNEALAHPKAQDHYLELEMVLFGKRYAGPNKDMLKLLEFASTLAIDQYKGSDAEKLKTLADAGIPELPPNVTDTKDQNEKGINFDASPNTHRRETHRGWDWNYQPDKANWPIRKKILLETVNNVFGFNSFSGKYDKQCNSLSALIYYVHIVGDHQEDSKYKAGGAITSLAEKNYGSSHFSAANRLPKPVLVVFASLAEKAHLK